MWNKYGGALIGVSLLSALALGVALSGVFFNHGRARAVCDWAVSELFHSDDLIEVERAAVIIRALDCSISRRIPADWSPDK